MYDCLVVIVRHANGFFNIMFVDSLDQSSNAEYYVIMNTFTVTKVRMTQALQLRSGSDDGLNERPLRY